jgi:hypothetical protein
MSVLLEKLIVIYLVGQEIPRLSQKHTVHYPDHKSLPLGPTLNQMTPGHAVTTCFFKIHFNVDLPSTPRRHVWLSTHFDY